MDSWDIACNFSSEILIIIATVVAAGFNFYFFGISKEVPADKSLAGHFLTYHPSLNKQLYAHNASIKTEVVQRSPIIPEAFADNASLETIALASEEENNFVINDNTIELRSPDSVRSLMSKQIKIYKTESGDTLASIAKANKISQDTIKWANNLPNNSIKPGWDLIILPVNGVLVKANSNTTLPDVAHKYEASLDRIIAYNSLENAEDIDEGQIIIVPDGKITPPPAPKPTPAPKPKSSTSKIADDTEDYTGTSGSGSTHIFPKGYCTWYVASKMTIKFGGNAKNWLANAKASGYVVGKEPATRAAVVTTDNKRYGHVAYVEKVEEDRILVSEMNYEKFGKMNTRWIPINSGTIRGYIYP